MKEENQKDKNQRPYAVSLDWLQLHTKMDIGFNENQEPLGYHYVDVGHGSKVFKRIIDIYDWDGCKIGNISLHPYSSSIKKETVIFKAENEILYEQNPIERIFEYLYAAKLKYIGITRIDIAYDFQELYGGMKPQTLMEKYFSRKILKLGNNDPWVKMVGGYKLKFKSNNSQKITLEDGKSGFGRFQTQSVTWGQRSSDVQVQLYNKSVELKEVKMKHHIVDWWKVNGLDHEQKDVYRIEIRITGLKTFRNQKTLKVFKLNASDLIMQEQIEHLFAAMASKYFRFFRRREISHIERMPEIKLFCIGKTPVFKPIHIKGRKDYTRGTKILLNWVEKQIMENANQKNVMTYHLQKVRDYLERTYELMKQKKETDRKNGTSCIENPNSYDDIYKYYADIYASDDMELYNIAAKAQKDFELQEKENWEKIECDHQKALELADRYEREDPSGGWKKDFETYSKIMDKYEKIAKTQRNYEKERAERNFYPSMRKALRENN